MKSPSAMGAARPSATLALRSCEVSDGCAALWPDAGRVGPSHSKQLPPFPLSSPWRGGQGVRPRDDTALSKPVAILKPRPDRTPAPDLATKPGGLMPMLYDANTLKDLAARRAANDEAARNGGTEAPGPFVTTSGRPIARLYGPTDLPDFDYTCDLGDPGEHPTGYRGKPWTIRMFAGFGSAEETNARYRYLLDHGETGLSVAFDMPTLMGYDTDDEWGLGEFGKCGVAVSSLADMEILFSGIPVDQFTTSMTINSPAAVIWAMYIAAAEKRGIGRETLGGTLQNDILKEYIAQNEFIFSPEDSMRLVTDTIEFGSQQLPKWNTISISGYHIREAGATAVQELAFTLADGIEYVKWGIARGLDVDSFAPRLSFFFNAHNDFFEEIAKYRAARSVWAKVMRERFGARNPRSWWLRFHTQT